MNRRIILAHTTGQQVEQILEGMRSANTNKLTVFIRRASGKICLAPIGKEWPFQCGSLAALSHVLERRCGLTFYRTNSHGLVDRCDPPAKALRRILAMPPEDTGLPILAFHEAPQ